MMIVSGSAIGQSFSVFDIDTTNFPIIKARYYALDSIGNQIKNLAPTDFEVKENGLIRTVTNVSYPQELPLESTSIAMGIDASWSMIYSDFWRTPKELSKTATTELCKAVGIPQSEFALQACHSTALIIQDFTKNKALMKILCEMMLDDHPELVNATFKTLEDSFEINIEK